MFENTAAKRRLKAGGIALAAAALLVPARLVAQMPGSTSNGAPGQAKLPYDITADHQELFNDEHRTVYSGNVEVVQGTDRLRTPRLTIFFAQKDAGAPKAKGAAATAGDTFGKIERMEAEGPVYFSNPTQNGRGDHGVYTAADQTTVLTGNVVLVQDKNVSTGDKLILNQATNQATLFAGDSSKRVRGVFYQDDNKAPVAGQPPGATPAGGKPAKSGKGKGSAHS